MNAAARECVRGMLLRGAANEVKMRFEVIHTCKQSGARVGKLYTEHGVIDTPCFMPVGTKATVKGLSPEEVKATGAQILLSNTYHLYLRPGHELIERAGGLHKFMNWDGAILTDSGGFQVFSLSSLRKVSDEGMYFNSFIDGSRHFFSPEKSAEIQRALGSDIVMAFDELTAPDISHERAEEAMERTLLWLDRCASVKLKSHQTLFPIIQGNMYADLRLESLKRSMPYATCGIAIGGLSVGESAETMYAMLDALAPHLPKDMPHYLMGVGTADYIVEGVARGVDMFDCVLPTRIARNGTAMVREGFLTIRNAPTRRISLPWTTPATATPAATTRAPTSATSSRRTRSWAGDCFPYTTSAFSKGLSPRSARLSCRTGISILRKIS